VSALMKAIRTIIPLLSPNLYKGQAGKIAVIGGSREYTGAPFYGAISALKTGADLSYIFCCESASTAIKSYAPELIVLPSLKTEEELPPNCNAKDREEVVKNSVKKVSEWLPRMTSLVIGSGLGRDPLIFEIITQIIGNIKRSELPVVLDGDALFLIAQNPSLVKDYRHAILTPNLNEFSNLCTKLGIESKQPKDLANCLGNVTVVQKGVVDVITDGYFELRCDTPGSIRRCGGQGDILAGTIALFLSWSLSKKLDPSQYMENPESVKHNIPPTVLAAYAGCMLTRLCSAEAFKKYKRSTTTPDIINEIGQVFESLFPAEYSKL